MSTPLTDFYETLRVLLDDDEDVQQRSDDQLRNGLRSVIRLNRVPNYALDTDLVSITPDITDPNVFALVALHAAHVFTAPRAHSYSYRRRAQGESFGDRRLFLASLEDEIHALENGSKFRGWQTYVDYFQGKVGLPLAGKMTTVKQDAPWQTIYLPRGSVSPGGVSSE